MRCGCTSAPNGAVRLAVNTEAALLLLPSLFSKFTNREIVSSISCADPNIFHGFFGCAGRHSYWSIVGYNCLVKVNSIGIDVVGNVAFLPGRVFEALDTIDRLAEVALEIVEMA